MITTLVRIIKYGVQSFWRNRLLSVATILVLILALLTFELLIIFNAVANTAISSLQDKIDISVYFKQSAAEDDIFRLERSLESLTEVKVVEYISRDKALELFKAEHGSDVTVSQALEELDNNPLLASLNIRANELEDYASIATYLENESFRDLIENVTYSQSKGAIELLNTIIKTVERIGFGLNIFVALTAALVTFNTIQLAIYSNREEISIMRLVGASNIFINGPYIIGGIIYGVVAATVGVLFTMPFIISLSPGVAVFIPEMNLESYFFSNLLSIYGSLLVFGVALGVVSSSIAVRRYLKT